MSSYLLRATPEDFTRWKLAADAAGLTLAAFFRQGADVYAQCIAFPEAAFHVPSTNVSAFVERTIPTTGKRSYLPDLRPTARRGKK